MKNWNKTGKIKAIVIAVVFLANLFTAFPSDKPLQLPVVLMPFFFGCIAIPLIAKFNAAIGREISAPDWNDSPFTSKPLSFFHFGASFFLASGIGILIGTGIRFHAVNSIGLTAIDFGIGIWAGIKLMLKLSNKNSIKKYSAEQKKIWAYAQLYDSLVLFALDHDSLTKMAGPTFEPKMELWSCFEYAFHTVYNQITELDAIKSLNLKPQLDEFAKKVNGLDESFWTYESLKIKPEWEDLRKDADRLLNLLGETHNREFEKYYEMLPK